MSTGVLGVRLQQLEGAEQWLVLGRLAAARSETGQFSPRDVEDLALNLSVPVKMRSDHASRALSSRGWARRGGARGQWLLTPVGRAASNDLFAETELAALAAEAAVERGADLGHTRHAVVPPALAPVGLMHGLRQFLDAFPFDRNVFAMTRFPHEEDVDPVKDAVAVARNACDRHGLKLHLASDRAIDDDLWTNVMGHMWGSRYGLAFFEDRVGRGLNYNMTIEVGGMLVSGRRCALLKDNSIDDMPTDLVGRIYKEVDLSDLDSVEATVHSWIRDDLGLESCDRCPAAT